MEPPKMYSGKAIWNKYVLNFLWKVSIVSEDLIVIGSWFQIVATVREKAEQVLGTKTSLETDDVRVLEISEKCSRLTKYVSCVVERVRYVTVANLNLIWSTTGSQCNCLSSGSGGEKRRVLSTTHPKQFCTRWSLDKYYDYLNILYNMLWPP